MFRHIKLLLIVIGFFCIPATLLAYVSPGKATGFMNDFAGILTVEQEKEIEMRLAVLNMTSGTEVAMVTVPSLGDETIEVYATKLFEEWGIGGAQQDDGLLVLIAPNDRQVRIEVGYGLEGAVTDIQSGNIIRSVMTPAFAEGDYYAGMTGATDALIAIINNSPEAAQYSVENNPQTNSGEKDYFALIFFAIIVLNILAGILGKTKSWWLGGVLGVGAGVVIGIIFGWIPIGFSAMAILGVLGLVFDYIVSKHPPKGGGGGHGGGWMLPLLFMGGGRGGSGGGFGGFGGGMSGGGGASGRW